MIDGRKSGEVSIDPWLHTGHRFQVVAVLTLISFGVFAVYDSRTFYARYLTRCEVAPDRPECAFLNITRSKPRPDLGIVMDNETGRWALQLEATDERTANENAARLWNDGANPRLVRMASRNKAAFYYIQLGRFKTQKDARSASVQLKAKGVTMNFVVAEYRSATK